MANSENYFAVIMAGGVGSRFWPASTKQHPKQFQDLLGTGKSFLQTTFERVVKVIPRDQIYVLTNAFYRDLVREQLPSLSAEQIVLEPAMRNTAPCNLLAALKIYKKNPNAVITVAPSDHFINDDEKFCANLRLALQNCAEHHDLLTLGIQPTKPHTGYGYIKFQNEDSALKPVESFTEKPDLPRAKEFLNDGNYLWNAGIFIWRADDVLRAFEEFLPDMYRVLTEGFDQLNTAGEESFLEQNYPKAENISIDYGIMEHARNVKVIPAEFQWSDIGSWLSLYEKVDKDENENVVISGKAHITNSSANIIRVDKERVIAVKGLDDFIVVEEDGALLICPKSDEQEVKEIRAEVGEKFGKDWV